MECVRPLCVAHPLRREALLDQDLVSYLPQLGGDKFALRNRFHAVPSLSVAQPYIPTEVLREVPANHGTMGAVEEHIRLNRAPIAGLAPPPDQEEPPDFLRRTALLRASSPQAQYSRYGGPQPSASDISVAALLEHQRPVSANPPLPDHLRFGKCRITFGGPSVNAKRSRANPPLVNLRGGRSTGSDKAFPIAPGGESDEEIEEIPTADMARISWPGDQERSQSPRLSGWNSVRQSQGAAPDRFSSTQEHESMTWQRTHPPHPPLFSLTD